MTASTFAEKKIRLYIPSHYVFADLNLSLGLTKFRTVFFLQKSDGSFQKQNLRGRFGFTSSAVALNLGSLLSYCQEPHKNSTEDCFSNLVLPQQKVCYRFPQSARISRDAAPTRLQRKKNLKNLRPLRAAVAA